MCFVGGRERWSRHMLDGVLIESCQVASNEPSPSMCVHRHVGSRRCCLNKEEGDNVTYLVDGRQGPLRRRPGHDAIEHLESWKEARKAIDRSVGWLVGQYEAMPTISLARAHMPSSLPFLLRNKIKEQEPVFPQNQVNQNTPRLRWGAGSGSGWIRPTPRRRCACRDRPVAAPVFCIVCVC